jgi:ankyrin repeat protein
MPSPKRVSFHVVISLSPPFCLQDARWSALHYAAFNGYLAFAKRLLERGADATLRTNTGQTALDLARKKGHGEVKYLLSEPRTRYADEDRPPRAS